MHRIAILFAALPVVSFACDRETPTPDITEPPSRPAAPNTAGIETPTTQSGRAGVEAMRHVDPGADEPEPVRQAMAVMHSTEGHDVQGTISFTEVDGKGVKVDVALERVPAGTHAFHVHLLGDCSGDDGKSAGTHFNFDGPSRHPPEDIDRITGDLGELRAEPDGKVSFTTTVEDATLQGRYSIIGRSVIVHEKGNDPDQPPIGAAGGRIACGVVGIDGPE